MELPIMTILRSASTPSRAAGLCICVLMLARCFTVVPATTGGDGGASQDAPTDGATTSCAFDGGPRTYGPYDPHIQYVGRIDSSDPAGPWFAESATYVTAKFRGNTVSALIHDENFGG